MHAAWRGNMVAAFLHTGGVVNGLRFSLTSNWESKFPVWIEDTTATNIDVLTLHEFQRLLSSFSYVAVASPRQTFAIKVRLMHLISQQCLDQ